MCFVRLDRSPASLAALALAALAPTAFGQMVWSKVLTSTSPPHLAMHAMAYDSSRQRIVLFGGGPWGNPTNADTWEYDGKTWARNSLPFARPSARIWHAMAFDRTRRVIVLFGGYDTQNALSDTWEYDGILWRRRNPATSPPRLYQHAMAYDRARRVMVVFGGNQTWEWDGTNWRRRSLAVSPPRMISHGHGMVYDSARRVFVLHGGVGIAGGFFVQLRDTWEWDGSNKGWVHRTSGSARWGRLVYDEARHRSVWCTSRTGTQQSTVDTDVWEWDGGTWQPVLVGGLTPGRAWHHVAYDSARQRVVLFGGLYGSFSANDTWEYYPTDRGTATAVGLGCTGSSGLPTLAADGPPIVGNQDFKVRIGSGRATSPAFAGLSLKPANLPIGGCTLFLNVSQTSLVLLTGRTTVSGVAEFTMPIPHNRALGGFRVEIQGFVSDPAGTYFGLLAFTNGLRLVIGD